MLMPMYNPNYSIISKELWLFVVLGDLVLHGKKLKAALETQNKTQIVLDSKPAPWIALYGFILESGFILLMIIGTSRLISGSLSPSQFVFFPCISTPHLSTIL